MFWESITPLPLYFSHITPYYIFYHIFTQIFMFMKETLQNIVFKMLKVNWPNRPKKPGAPNLLCKYYMKNYGLTFQMSYSVPVVYIVPSNLEIVFLFLFFLDVVSSITHVNIILLLDYSGCCWDRYFKSNYISVTCYILLSMPLFKFYNIFRMAYLFINLFIHWVIYWVIYLFIFHFWKYWDFHNILEKKGKIWKNMNK